MDKHYYTQNSWNPVGTLGIIIIFTIIVIVVVIVITTTTYFIMCSKTHGILKGNRAHWEHMKIKYPLSRAPRENTRLTSQILATHAF